MKVPPFFRQFLSFVWLVVSAAMISSCIYEGNRTGQQEGPAAGDSLPKSYASPEEQLAISPDTASLKEKEVFFAAAISNMLEVKASSLAVKKGSPAVREMAKVLEQELRQGMSEMRALAAEKQIVLPQVIDPAGEQAYTSLNEVTDPYFDNSYCDLVTREHERTIELLERLLNGTRDTEIRTWVMAYITTMQRQLSQARSCRGNDRPPGNYGK